MWNDSFIRAPNCTLHDIFCLFPLNIWSMGIFSSLPIWVRKLWNFVWVKKLLQILLTNSLVSIGAGSLNFAAIPLSDLAIRRSEKSYSLQLIVKLIL